MNYPIFENEDDGYSPAGHWINEGYGFMSYVPEELMSYKYPDLVEMVEPRVKEWKMHGADFDNKREAQLLAGRILIFHKGVKVVKRDSRYYVLYWEL